MSRASTTPGPPAATGPVRAAAGPPPRIAPIEPYCRLTLGFVIGLYLPWASAAPDLLRHFGEAVHSWVVIFFWPVAVWRLLRRALPTTDGDGEGQG